MKIEESLDTIKDFTKESTENNLDKLDGLLKEYELDNIHSDFIEKLIFLFIAALGIITAVAWDQVLKLIAQELFDKVGDVWSKVIYAIFVTAITVLVSIIVNKVYMKRRNKIGRKSFVEILRLIIRSEKR